MFGVMKRMLLVRCNSRCVHRSSPFLFYSCMRLRFMQPCSKAGPVILADCSDRIVFDAKDRIECVAEQNRQRKTKSRAYRTTPVGIPLFWGHDLTINPD